MLSSAVLLGAMPLVSTLGFGWSQSNSNSKEIAITKRATNNTTPSAISIGPSQYWDGNDGPWSSFPIQIGTPAQDVRTMVSTNLNSVVTIGSGGCIPQYGSTCADNRGQLFLYNTSLTWVPNSRFDIGIEKNLGMDTTGDAGFDTVTAGWQGSGGPTINHNIVFAVNSATYWIGLFGLSPHPANFTTLVDPQPAFMSQLVNYNYIPSLSYGYTAGNQYRFNGIYGSLTLGGYDQNRFVSTPVTFPFYADISRELLVNVQAITTNYSSGTTNLLSGGSIPMFIDSSVSQIWLPESACTVFEEIFHLTWDDSSQLYLVNTSLHSTLLAANPTVTFTLGTSASGGSTVNITLPYAAFDLNVGFPIVANQSYYFPLKRATNVTQYTLGRTFLQEAYLITDYDRQNFTVAPCLWDAAKVNTVNIVTIHRNTGSSSSGLSGGAIAGIVIGVVVGGIAILGGIFFWLRRRRQSRLRLAELDPNSAAAASKDPHGSDPASPSEAKPFISAPIGGELGDGEIHELTNTARPAASEMDAKPDPAAFGYYSEMDSTGRKLSVPVVEVQGSTPIYEMAGSDVHEMAAREISLATGGEKR